MKDDEQENSLSKKYVLEEFVQGQLYSHSAFIVNHEIIIDFFVEEHCVVNPYAVDTSKIAYEFDEKIKSDIRDDITKMAKELKLVDGLIHTQFIYDGKSFWIIEVNRRCPGDLYSKLIELSTGFPYAEFYARPFLNISNQIQIPTLKESLVLRHTITSQDKISFSSISFNSPKNIIKHVPLSTSGDVMEKSPKGRMGILFLSENTKEDFNITFKETLERNLYNLELIDDC